LFCEQDLKKMCADGNKPCLVDLSKTIGHTSLTIGWLLGKLEESCEEFRRVYKTDVVLKVNVSLMGVSQGHNSTLYLLDVHFKNAKLMQFCLKTPPADDKDFFDGMKRQIGSEHKIMAHNRECTFYENMKSGPYLKLPQIYSIKQMKNIEELDAHILMEFLGPEADIIPLSQCYTRDQIFAVIEQIAFINAFSVVNKDQLEGIFGDHKMKRPDPKKLKIMEEHHEKIIEQIEKQGGGEFVPIFRSLYKRADRDRFNHYICNQFHKENGVPSVLTHFDLWGNNILFEKNENGFFTSTVSAIIDWQFAGYGNPTTDIARLLVMNTSAQVRRQIQDETLDFYHERFHNTLELLQGSKLPELFSLSQLKLVYNASIITQVHFATFIGTVYFSQNFNQTKNQRDYLDKLKIAALEATEIMDKQFSDWKVVD